MPPASQGILKNRPKELLSEEHRVLPENVLVKEEVMDDIAGGVAVAGVRHHRDELGVTIVRAKMRRAIQNIVRKMRPAAQRITTRRRRRALTRMRRSMMTLNR
jgi:hypothetical protein